MRPRTLTDLVARSIEYVHGCLDDHGIWHCLTYGTLLGAIRDQDVIAWDGDFDFFIKPSDVPRILALNRDIAADGYAFQRMSIYTTLLAVNPRGYTSTLGCAIGVYKGQQKIGDLYAMELFNDGILRRYDVEQEVYWLPHSSFPHFFVEALSTGVLRGRTYPVPQHADTFIAGVYGEDWRVPYRAARQGGATREGRTEYSDLYEPKLDREIAWCVAHGWDRSQYAFERVWPRDVRAAGPIGPTGRTLESSGALWWRSRDELFTHF